MSVTWQTQAPVTAGDLRAELQNFAEGALRSQLETVTNAVTNAIRKEVRCEFWLSDRSRTVSGDQNGRCNTASADMAAGAATHIPPPAFPLPGAVESPAGPHPEHKQPSWTQASTVGRMLRSEVRCEFEEKEDTLLSSGTSSSSVKVQPAPEATMEESKCLKAEGNSDVALAVHSEASHTSQEDKKSEFLRKRSASRGSPLEKALHSKTQELAQRGPINKIVTSVVFEYIVMVIISANAFYIGLATNYMSQQAADTQPVAFDVVENIFLCLFLLELGMKIFVYRGSLFRRLSSSGRRNPNFYWNIFDTVVIGLQAIEMLCRALNFNADLLAGVSVLRVLRLLRLGRIVRLVKVFRLVTHLRTIVYSIGNSLSLLFWSIVALLLVTYLWAVYLTEAVWGFKIHGGAARGYDVESLDRYFGSLDKSMLSLLQAITGGCDWGDLSTPLSQLDMYTGLVPFLAYIFFALLAMMNVITGVFLETASERAKEEREIFLMRNARSIFSAADHNHNGTVTWKDFQGALDNKGVSQFFDAIELDVSEAETLFELLDTSGDGVVSADEFLCGCLRLRGHAKALDLLVLSRDVTRLFDLNKEALVSISQRLEIAIELAQGNFEATRDVERLMSGDRRAAASSVRESKILTVVS
eukprot:TRINITY_DN1284_c1_g3_i1.p1 TRINITY_DN1284_c1_g3~~TRINITY_DN1284_c1_g3_i1.p1  ORF type:complete len:642 (-),score=116.18 TRINITY_DN1284_c1_g3_i1:286-2211(-)